MPILSETPSEWAVEFAAQHGIRLKCETPIPGDLPALKYEDEHGPVVLLEAKLPHERQNFSLAHEVAHVLLGHSGELGPLEENEADTLASELLLPREQFEPEAWRNLRELKELFPHASFEALARRKITLTPGGLTIWDNMKLVRRLSGLEFALPPHPTQPEFQLAKQAYEQRSDVTVEGDGYSLEATYVDEGRGVIRVLLLVVGE